MKIDSKNANTKKEDGWYAEVLTYIGKSRKNPGRMQYFVDNKGYIFQGLHTVKGFERDLIPRAKTSPCNGDTIFEDGWDKDRPLIYTVKGDTCLLESPVGTEKPTRIIFIRGIGQIGRAYGPISAKNLIEYRIGNGPVIKKHWLMEAPVKK